MPDSIEGQYAAQKQGGVLEQEASRARIEEQRLAEIAALRRANEELVAKNEELARERDALREIADTLDERGRGYEEKITEQALLLKQQQHEIAELRRQLEAAPRLKALGTLEPPSIGPEQEEDRELAMVLEQVEAFATNGDREALRGFIRSYKRQVEKRAAREASRDALTGLPNRGTFIDDAEKLLNLVREKPEYEMYLRENPNAQRREQVPLDEGDFSVILLDLDHFKSINDTYGHAAGDAVLKAVADALRKHLRPTDEIARWGGEEFIVAFKSNRRGARVIVAEKIRRVIEGLTIVQNGKPIPVTASVGAAKWHVGETLDDVIQSADSYLYKSKEGGRNRISVDIVE